jgi:LacI family transcriptional regulator
MQGFVSEMSSVPGAQPIVGEGDFSSHSGRAVVGAWLRGDVMPTAIIGVNDLVALGAIEGLVAAGLDVPRDVAVAGFDDIRMAGSPLISLTSVAQHIDEMGARAVRLLLGMAAKPRVKPVRETVVPDLVIRRSTSDAVDDGEIGQEDEQ